MIQTLDPTSDDEKTMDFLKLASVLRDIADAIEDEAAPRVPETPETPETPEELTLQDLQGVVTGLIQRGKKDYVLTVLKAAGLKNLSSAAPTDYSSLMALLKKAGA